MSDIPASFFHYLAAWNEMDPAKVRSHLEGHVTADVFFDDPLHTTEGIDALEAMIVDARKERPGASYHRTSGVDSHNRRYRYLWEVRVDGSPVMPGMDITHVDAKGIITRIDGYFGGFPPLEG